MYRHTFSLSNGPSDLTGLALHVVWQVNGDPSYDMGRNRSTGTSKRLRSDGGTGLIAIRTKRGEGEVRLRGSPAVIVKRDTLLILTWEKLLRYRCIAKAWDFWWCEFSLSGPSRLPLCELLQIPEKRGEQAEMARIFGRLGSESLFERLHATAAFTKLLYGWMACRQGLSARSPHADSIHGVIEEFHRDLARKWSVSEMARHAGMSERNFRREFLRVTGLPPQKFFRNLRLGAAERLIRQGRITIDQAAGMLGFSDAFHLSRLFRKRYGFSPSALKRGR